MLQTFTRTTAGPWACESPGALARHDASLTRAPDSAPQLQEMCDALEAGRNGETTAGGVGAQPLGSQADAQMEKPPTN